MHHIGLGWIGVVCGLVGGLVGYLLARLVQLADLVCRWVGWLGGVWVGWGLGWVGFGLGWVWVGLGGVGLGVGWVWGGLGGGVGLGGVGWGGVGWGWVVLVGRLAACSLDWLMGSWVD